MKGEVVVAGEIIYLTVYGYSTQHLNNVYMKERYDFVIDPADDLYTFILDNTEGYTESSAKFTFEEIWTGPISIGSHASFITWLMGFFLFPTGLLALAINHVKRRIEE